MDEWAWEGIAHAGNYNDPLLGSEANLEGKKLVKDQIRPRS
jgi:hypothetical protein